MLNMFTISIGSALVVSLETKIKILGIFEWVLFVFKIDFIPFQVFLML